MIPDLFVNPHRNENSLKRCLPSRWIELKNSVPEIFGFRIEIFGYLIIGLKEPVFKNTSAWTSGTKTGTRPSCATFASGDAVL